MGRFTAKGGSFWLTDNANDGRSVAIYWLLTDGSRRGIVRDRLGHESGWRGAVVNLPEHKKVCIRLGTCDETKAKSCHHLSDDTWYTKAVDTTSTT